MDVLAATTAWSDAWWDEERGLLWNMAGSFDGAPARTFHCVVQSAWYAFGLLHRRGEGDLARAAQAIDSVIGLQYDEPGTVWHGTFARFAETPRPRPGAVEWVDYDPNWRQFIGTTFQLLLDDPAATADLGTARVAQMDAAVALAVAGEPPGRVAPSYANIALMKAWLDTRRGAAGADEFTGAVVAVFDEHGTFHEYNSATYYGVDLFALGLWARFAPSPELAEAGRRIEAALWRDITRWYHPGLGNLCGPYTRAYGMDLHDYASLLGLWLVPALGAAAPFPPIGSGYGHAHDTTMGPLAAVVGVDIPDDAHAGLVAFTGEHTVEQVVSSRPARVATGWLADGVMCGGERGENRAQARGQFHPATAHWRQDDGSIGWLRVVHGAPVDATASAGRLDISCQPHPRRGPQAPELWIRSHRAPSGEGPWRLDGVTIDCAATPEEVGVADGVTRLRFAAGTEDLSLLFG